MGPAEALARSPTHRHAACAALGIARPAMPRGRPFIKSLRWPTVALRAVLLRRGTRQTSIAACDAILACRGRVVVLGVGKSGHIGNKIAATLASTGTPAFFVHAAEANHGDLGMITAEDVVLVLSNSGETDEVKQLLPVLKRLHVVLIAMTGNPGSYLAEFADINLDVRVREEACPLGLAANKNKPRKLA